MSLVSRDTFDLSFSWTRRLRLAEMHSVLVSAGMVRDSTMKKSYDRVVLAIVKSGLLFYMVLMVRENLLSLPSWLRIVETKMDDQIYGRTLVGAYFCTDQPGEFIWHSLGHLPRRSSSMSTCFSGDLSEEEVGDGCLDDWEANCNKAKKILYPIDMEFKKIHAYPNDCILYTKEFEATLENVVRRRC
ncbi:hypothetical protein CR513_34011, partial [Mucuna pruriens]